DAPKPSPPGQRRRRNGVCARPRRLRLARCARDRNSRIRPARGSAVMPLVLVDAPAFLAGFLELVVCEILEDDRLLRGAQLAQRLEKIRKAPRAEMPLLPGLVAERVARGNRRAAVGFRFERLEVHLDDSDVAAGARDEPVDVPGVAAQRARQVDRLLFELDRRPGPTVALRP